MEDVDKDSWECIATIRTELGSRPGWARVGRFHLCSLFPFPKDVEELLIEIDSTTVHGQTRVSYYKKERKLVTPVSEAFEGLIQINHNHLAGTVSLFFLVDEGLPPQTIEIEGKIYKSKTAKKQREKKKT